LVNLRVISIWLKRFANASLALKIIVFDPKGTITLIALLPLESLLFFFVALTDATIIDSPVWGSRARTSLYVLVP